MNEPRIAVAGDGPLTYGRVLRQAAGMARRRWNRVALVALILFVPPPLIAAVMEGVREHLEADPRLIAGLGYVLGLLIATAIRLFGPVVYAGYLDEAVGKEYFHGEYMPFVEVLRRLPWIRLIAAEIVLIAGTTIGLAFFVIPGLIFLTLFALIGPVIVQEDHGVISGFRRTFQLSRRAWPMIALLVVVGIVVEHFVHEGIHEIFHHSALWVQIMTAWLVAAVIGGAVGLIEVALATELMTRTPITASRDS